MTTRSRKKPADEFIRLTALLGLDRDSLLDYLNWCLLEHLVAELSLDKAWLTSIRARPNALALFRAKVEKRTKCKWDTDNTAVLYERVKLAGEKHFRQPITYGELLRLLINSPLKCAKCGKAPPDVKLHIDHVLAVSRGGPSRFENLQFLCAACNLSKSNKLEKTELWLRLEFLQPS